MNSKDCLTEQELTLHYYGELDEARHRHPADCEPCAQRLAALTAQLDRLPTPDCTPDAHAGVRMAARVGERLANRRRKSWLPALGAGAVATLALVLSLSLAPQPKMPQVTQVSQVTHSSPPPATLAGLEEDMPDIEFLDDIELLKELDLLAQIEGV